MLNAMPSIRITQARRHAKPKSVECLVLLLQCVALHHRHCHHILPQSSTMITVSIITIIIILITITITIINIIIIIISITITINGISSMMRSQVYLLLLYVLKSGIRPSVIVAIQTGCDHRFNCPCGREVRGAASSDGYAHSYFRDDRWLLCFSTLSARPSLKDRIRDRAFVKSRLAVLKTSKSRCGMGW